MRHRRKRRGRIRRFTTKLFFVLVVAALLWGTGFFAFMDRIPRPQPPDGEGPKADAIVVLTGGGGRLETGFRLLAVGRAAKLFISGVHPRVEDAALLQNSQLDAAMLACCVATGHAAHDTFGNAVETAHWMNEEGFTSLYIVTANYHMPRSLIEFSAVMPTVELLPYPVHPGNVHLDDWWRWPGTIRLLAVEYTKYLATRARIFVTR